MTVSTVRGESASPTSMALNRTQLFSGQSSSGTSGWWRHHLPAPLGWEISSCPCSFLERSGCCLHDSREKGAWQMMMMNEGAVLSPVQHKHHANLFSPSTQELNQTSQASRLLELIFMNRKNHTFPNKWSAAFIIFQVALQFPDILKHKALCLTLFIRANMLWLRHFQTSRRG